MWRRCRILAPNGPCRSFSSGRIVGNKQDARAILRQGFEKMESLKYKKTSEDKKALQQAAESLGLSGAEVGQMYDSVQPGSVPYDKLSADQKYAAGRAEIQSLSGSELEETFEFDDLPPLGHMQLQDHRMQREYNRIAAYDLPLLAQQASEFRPPTEQEVFKFEYVSYLGEPHPGHAKVVVTFKTARLGLDETELHKFRLLCGTRYDPTKDEVKIGCERFPEQAQNKRFIAQAIRDLIKNAKDKTETFADIPIDDRHIKARKRRRSLYPNYPFPKEWERPQDAPVKKTNILEQLGYSRSD